jgi:hypothetical protein
LEVSKRGAEGHGVMVARDFCCFVVSRRAAARQKDDVFYQKAYESTRVTYEPAVVGTVLGALSRHLPPPGCKKAATVVPLRLRNGMYRRLIMRDVEGVGRGLR